MERFPDEEVNYPVLKPTEEEFRRGFRWYIENVMMKVPEWKETGVLKMIPPKAWLDKLSKEPSERLQTVRPVTQMPVGRKGSFQLALEEQKPISWKKFASIANSETHKPFLAPERATVRKLDREFWSRVTSETPAQYGSDMEGSLFEAGKDYWGWNCNELDNDLRRLPRDIPGVTRSMLYAGMFKSCFAWHTEDLDLFALNFLHWGAPKSWWVVPPSNKKSFETRMDGVCAAVRHETGCKAFLRHKTSLVSPSHLEGAARVTRVIQRQGEWIFVYAGAFHCGYNHGLNVAESVNFCFPQWLPFGRVAEKQRCPCNPLAVSFAVDSIYPPTPSSFSALPGASGVGEGGGEGGGGGGGGGEGGGEGESCSGSAAGGGGSAGEDVTLGVKRTYAAVEGAAGEKVLEPVFLTDKAADATATWRKRIFSLFRATQTKSKESPTKRAKKASAGPLQVAIMWTDGIVYVAVVEDIAQPMFRIHYPGWPRVYDEWIHFQAVRFVGYADSSGEVVHKW